MTVSVILTSYKRPILVRQAIESVLSQTYSDYELIIIDDNSGPETWKVLQEYADDALILTTLIDEASRINKTRYSVCINLGIKISSGDYITYLTDDDLYKPYRLEVMVSAIQDRHIVYGNQEVVDIDEQGRILGRRGLRGTFGVTRKPMAFIDHNSVMHRRECLDYISYPWWPEEPEAWCGADGIFFKKLAELWPFYPIEQVLDIHRWHKRQIQTRMIKENRGPLYG